MTPVDAQGAPSLHDRSGVDAVSDGRDEVKSPCIDRGRKPLDFKLFALLFTVLAVFLGAASAPRPSAAPSAALLQVEVAEVRLNGPSRSEDARAFALDETRQRDHTTSSNAVLSEPLSDESDAPGLQFNVVKVDIDETLQDAATHLWLGLASQLVFCWEDLSAAPWEIEVRGDTSRFSIETGLPRGPPSMG